MNTKEITIAQKLINRQNSIQSSLENMRAMESQEVRIPCPDPTSIFVAPTISIDKARFIAFLENELKETAGKLYAMGVDMPEMEKAQT